MERKDNNITADNTTWITSIGHRSLTRVVLTVVFVLAFSVTSFFISQHDYLLFHSFVEAFSIVIAFATFAIAWNSRRIVQNGYLLFVGIAFLAVSLVDLVHTLAYQGMGVFPGYDANLATQLWLAGRYLLSVSLLVAPLTIGRRLNVPLTILVFTIVVIIVFTTVFSGIFPVAYVNGVGLTSFKIASEYTVSFILLCAIALLFIKRRSLNPDFIKLLTASIATMIVSEMAFTLYSDVYGIANMIGHLAKVAAYYLVYKALVEMALVKPYNLLFRELKRNELSLAKQTSELTTTNNRLVQEVADRKKAEQEISRQERRFHDTLDRMFEGCQIIDYAWKYVYVNDSAAIHGHRRKDELLGYTMMEVYPGIENTVLFTQLKQCMDNRQPCRIENENKYSDGSKAWFELSLQPVPEGIFILSLDISERKQSEQMKDEFIGMVSHELKNPLTVIIGALSTVTGGGIPEPEAHVLLQDAVSEAEELTSMVDNLLELSRQQASRLVLQTESVDIIKSMDSVARKIESRLTLHRLIIDIPGGLPPVRADKTRVERILYNLVDNAIKYSPDGGEVKVSARIRNDEVHISVVDHGIGIGIEDQTRLFQSFERVLTPGNNIKGTGLGLRVCQILVEAHGGRIWVDSAPQKGSTFHFTLPLSK